MKKQQIETASAVLQGVYTNKQGQSYFTRYEESYQHKSDENNIIKNESYTLNEIQRSMYRRLMYGLSEYTPEQKQAMSPQIISKIVYDSEKAKRIVHVLKVNEYYKAENKLFNTLFPNLNIGSRFADYDIYLPKHATLNKLKISTEKVCTEFIKSNLLPWNFFKLTVDNATL